jgi:large subunit ribosomal protein L1
MSLNAASLKEGISKALSEENNPKRNFVQSVQAFIKIRELDVSKSENRFSLVVELPQTSERTERSICVLTEGSLAAQAKTLGVDVLARVDIEPLAGNKKTARRMARKYDFFISEAPLMPLVGRVLGQFLAPKDRMPITVPPNTDISAHVARLRRSVRARLKTQRVVAVTIGSEDMAVEKLSENMNRVITAIEEKLPGGSRNIESILLKTSMGKKVKLVVSRYA